MKKSIFARFTSMALACAMALCVAAGAISAGTYTASLTDASSNNHSSGLLADEDTTVVVANDVATVTVPLQVMEYYGYFGTVTDATTDVEGYDVSVNDDGNLVIKTAADETALTGDGVDIIFTMDIVDENDIVFVHGKASTATLTLS